MAQRRMMSKTIIETDYFMEMPATTQNLYLHMLLRADDDGFISSYRQIMRALGAKEDDLKLLIAKRFLIWFESEVIVIKHWLIHNYIQNDRYTPTSFIDEKKLLRIKENNVYSLDEGVPVMSVSTVDTRLDTSCTRSIGKVSIDKVSKKSALKKLTKEEEDQFEAWWKLYPRKVAKKKCHDWWQKKHPDQKLLDTLTQSVVDHIKSKQWKLGYIPHPYTFLNQERYNDPVEIEKPTKQFKSYGQ